MNTDSPKGAGPGSPMKQSLDGTKEEPLDVSEDSLFHAYAIKVRHRNTSRGVCTI